MDSLLAENPSSCYQEHDKWYQSRSGSRDSLCDSARSIYSEFERTIYVKVTQARLPIIKDTLFQVFGIFGIEDTMILSKGGDFEALLRFELPLNAKLAKCYDGRYIYDGGELLAVDYWSQYVLNEILVSKNRPEIMSLVGSMVNGMVIDKMLGLNPIDELSKETIDNVVVAQIDAPQVFDEMPVLESKAGEKILVGRMIIVAENVSHYCKSKRLCELLILITKKSQCNLSEKPLVNVRNSKERKMRENTVEESAVFERVKRAVDSGVALSNSIADANGEFGNIRSLFVKRKNSHCVDLMKSNAYSNTSTSKKLHTVWLVFIGVSECEKLQVRFIYMIAWIVLSYVSKQSYREATMQIKFFYNIRATPNKVEFQVCENRVIEEQSPIVCIATKTPLVIIAAVKELAGIMAKVAQGMSFCCKSKTLQKFLVVMAKMSRCNIALSHDVCRDGLLRMCKSLGWVFLRKFWPKINNRLCVMEEVFLYARLPEVSDIVKIGSMKSVSEDVYDMVVQSYFSSSKRVMRVGIGKEGRVIRELKHAYNCEVLQEMGDLVEQSNLLNVLEISDIQLRWVYKVPWVMLLHSFAQWTRKTLEKQVLQDSYCQVWRTNPTRSLRTRILSKGQCHILGTERGMSL